MKYWSLMMILLVFGCAGGGGEEEVTYEHCSPSVSSGLEIANFYPELAEVLTTDEDITFTLETQNFGDSKATNIKAEIFNYGGFAPEETEQTIGDIESYTPDAAFVEQANWVLDPPKDIGTGEPRTYEIKAKLSFDYASSGEVDLVYIPDQEWRIRRQEGNTAIEDNQQCSGGPVAVSVEPRNPVIASPGSDSEFTFRVIVSNLGEGRVWSSTEGLDKIDRIEVSLPEGGEIVEGSSCQDFTYENAADKTKMITKKKVKLSMGESKILSCKLKLSDAPVREATYPIRAKAFYRYVIESSTEITVSPSLHSLDFTTGKDVLTQKPAAGDVAAVTTPKATKWNWKTEYLNVTIKPTYDGSWDDAYNASTVWTAEVTNKDVGESYDLKVAEAAYNETSDTFTLQLDRIAPAADEAYRDKLFGADPKAKIKVKLTFKGLQASKTIELQITDA